MKNREWKRLRSSRTTFCTYTDREQTSCLHGWKKQDFSQRQQAQSTTEHTQVVWWNIQTMYTADWFSWQQRRTNGEADGVFQNMQSAQSQL